jgi:NADP-dependent 3-hydroxy acid dehydrogenase YdfG
MKTLEGKVAVVTGASSGIGEAIALDLADKGANLVLVARREERLKDIADKINETGSQKVLVTTGDVTKKEDLETAVQKAKDEFGRIDFLINNAGVMLLSFLKNDKVEEWEQMVDVNIKGVLYGIHAALPEMIKQGSGHIVNVSSVAGHEVSPSSAVYSATKFAVRALSVGMEKELAKTGVKVTNISPGAVSTELTEHITDNEVRDMFESRGNSMTPLEANDIARAVTYAVSQPDNVNVNEMIVRPLNKKQ